MAEFVEQDVPLAVQHAISDQELSDRLRVQSISVSEPPRNVLMRFALRYIRGQWLFSQGRGERDLRSCASGAFGHDHLVTTEIYLNLSPEQVIKEFFGKR
jgi:hypothetical protein